LLLARNQSSFDLTAAGLVEEARTIPFELFYEGVMAQKVLTEASAPPPSVAANNDFEKSSKQWLESTVPLIPDDEIEGMLESIDLVDDGITNEDMAEMRRQWLFNPVSRWKTTWDNVTGLAVFYTVVEVPLRISFFLKEPLSPSNFAVNIFVTCVFGLDILATFNTAYIDPVTDRLVVDRWKIAARYAAFWLWVDIVSTIPFDAMNLGANSGALAIMRVLRLTRLQRLFALMSKEEFVRFLEKHGMSRQVHGIVVLVVQLLVMAHVCACFWWFMTTPTVTGPQRVAPSYDAYLDDPGAYTRTWAAVFGTYWTSTAERYIACIYFVFATILTIGTCRGPPTSFFVHRPVTQRFPSLLPSLLPRYAVGYGDIHATTINERIFAILLMLVGSLRFGLIVGKIDEIISNTNMIVKVTEEDVLAVPIATATTIVYDRECAPPRLYAGKTHPVGRID